jgi:hypothetical protein
MKSSGSWLIDERPDLGSGSLDGPRRSKPISAMRLGDPEAASAAVRFCRRAFMERRAFVYLRLITFAQVNGVFIGDTHHH